MVDEKNSSDNSLPSDVIFTDLGTVAYNDSYQKMLDVVTAKRGINNPNKQNQFWFLEHQPVFTQGVRAQVDNSSGNIRGIPLVNTDRGGLITYHGPGQLTVYALCHLHSKNVRNFVTFMEQVVIDTLASYEITARRRDGMPGVYVGDDKIASIGLRIKNGMSYHGISLNVNMDLTPFTYIDPCGYEGLKMIQMVDFIASITIDDVTQKLKQTLLLLLATNKF